MQSPNDVLSDLMSVEEVATVLGYQSPKALMNRIYRGKPIPAYIKVPGSRSVTFLRNDVIRFLKAHRVGDDDSDR